MIKTEEVETLRLLILDQWPSKFATQVRIPNSAISYDEAAGKGQL